MLLFFQFNVRNVSLRTKEMYNEHCRGLNGLLKDHISITYGISKKSILNDLQHFHVVTGLVPDIMHNILEGNGALVTVVYHATVARVTAAPLFICEM